MTKRIQLDSPRFVVIGGIIAAGKSTLTDAVGARIDNCIVMHEPVDDNPYLTDFYQNKERYALEMQLFLLEARARQHMLAVYALLSGRSVLQDRSIFEDEVFARMMRASGFIDARGFDTYMRFVEFFGVGLQHPDLIVYLDVSPEVAFARVQRRNRDAERSGLDLAYLTSLRDAYEEAIEDMQKRLHMTVVRLPGNEFLDAGDVLRVIDEYCAKSHETVRRWGRPHI